MNSSNSLWNKYLRTWTSELAQDEGFTQGLYFMQHMIQSMNYEIVTNLERLSCIHSWPQYPGLHTVLNHWDTFELNFCSQNICLIHHTCRNSLCQDYYAHTALNGDKNNTKYAVIDIIIYQLCCRHY